MKNKTFIRLIKKQCVVLLAAAFITATATAQPYLDIAYTKIQHSPDAGMWKRQNMPNRFTYFNGGLNIPVTFSDSSILVLSPATEIWDINVKNVSNLPPNFISLLMPATFIKPISSKWQLSVTAIARWNGNNKSIFQNRFQLGTALIAVYKKSKNLQYKFGAYYNSEFFGAFIIPLLGIDWKLDERNNLFGVLPGSLIYEHKVTNRFYWGAGFKAITNSYRIGNTLPDFFRMDDNQLYIYSDLYLSKKIVLNAELGHAVLRQLRMGIKNPGKKYYYTDKVNDNLLFKIMLAYRIRFR